MPEPVVVVIENPQEDPDVLYSPGVKVINLSTYPMSKWCPEGELLGYGQEYLEAIKAARDHFPVDSSQWTSLNEMAIDFYERLVEARYYDGVDPNVDA
jgi:hypothetical protein